MAAGAGPTFPGLSNIEGILRNIATLLGVINTSIGTIDTTFTGLNTAIGALNTTLTNAFPAPLTSSSTWNPSNLASGSSETTTITVAGATLGNTVALSFSLDLQGTSLVGYVSSTNTVTAVLNNLTGGSIDLASGTLLARVYTH